MAESRNTPLAYLRAFIIVLVVAQHAAMPYHVVLPAFEASSLQDHLESLRALAPVNDELRSGMLSLLTSFNDAFFMALLFLLSGLFVGPSLERKGPRGYLQDRLLRLGVPLGVMALIRPLTHYPTYLQHGGTGGFAGFWSEWGEVSWRGGPIWFLEVLLFFDVVVTAAALLGLRASTSRTDESKAATPGRFFLALVGASLLAYLPLTAALGPSSWVQVPLAQIELNRILFYLTYFVAGIVLGAPGLGGTFLASRTPLGDRWIRWSLAGLLTFAVSLGALLSGGSGLVAGVLYVLAAAALSFAFLAFFLRFAQRESTAWDSLFENSYGIYVFHYGVSSWFSFALLQAPLPAVGKFAAAFVGTLAACWGLTALLRRIPGVSRIL